MLYIKFENDPEPKAYPSGYPVELWISDIEERTGKKVVRADNLDEGRYTTWFRNNGQDIHVDGHLPAEDLAITLIDKKVTDHQLVKDVFGATVAAHFTVWSATNPTAN